MAKSDFRFRVSKAVGSPSVQGAATVETLANHTEDPHPHPQYMRKSYVGLGIDLTQHLANRLDHANNYALRDEITTTKLEYEKYKLISLAHDTSNYLSLTGVKAHLITSFVLNQILKDVGIDGSVKVLTYNNLVNSYDTRVDDTTKYAPTWDIFLKLRNSIPSWIYGKQVSQFMLATTFNNWVKNVYNKFVETQVEEFSQQWEDWKKEFIQYKKDVKDRWLKWVKYMYGEVASEDQKSEQYAHPVRPGLKVAMYTLPHRITKTLALPRSSTGASLDLDRLDTSFEPSLSEDTFQDILTVHVETQDTVRQSGKNYMKVENDELVDLAENEGFVTNTPYYEELKFTLNKTLGDHLTTGCSILEKTCDRHCTAFFDWYNGQNWRYWAGKIDSSEDHPFTPVVMVWHGHIRLTVGQTIRLRGFVDDWWYCKIGSKTLTEVDNSGSKWLLWTNETVDVTDPDNHVPARFVEYTATEEDAIRDVIIQEEEAEEDGQSVVTDSESLPEEDVPTGDDSSSEDETEPEPASELYEFTLAICNVHGVGPRVNSADILDTVNFEKSRFPLRMSLDGGETYIPITNEGLAEPVFYLPDGCEEAWHKAEDLRDKHNYKWPRRPGLLISMWQSNPVVTPTSVLSVANRRVYLYGGVNNPGTEDDEDYASEDYREIRKMLPSLHWATPMYIGARRTQRRAGDENTTIWETIEAHEPSYWYERKCQGPVITNGCGMLYAYTSTKDRGFFDWYNGLTWDYYCDTEIDSQNTAWYTKTFGWFGSIFLRIGETVKFEGRVDDFVTIVIDDTVLGDLDLIYSADYLPERTFTATYTGFHPFKLIARNIATQGPSAVGTDWEIYGHTGQEGPVVMSLNGGEYVKISNDSFVEPRFFLPEDCDHQKFWDDGILHRARCSADIESVVNMVYPVGSIYLSMDGTNPPFPGSRTTWVLIGQGRTIWGFDPNNNVNTGTLKSAGLPNITGKLGDVTDMTNSDKEILTANDLDKAWSQLPANHWLKTSSATKKSAITLTDRVDGPYGANSTGEGAGFKTISFDAHESSTIYGSSSTVQPPAIVVAMWKRTA